MTNTNKLALFVFEDGFECYSLNQKNADRKHNNFLAQTSNKWLDYYDYKSEITNQAKIWNRHKTHRHKRR